MRRLVLAIALALAAAVLVSAAAPAGTEQLAAAGRLWARLHYTHPWLAVKDIDWDRAFADAAPKILAADSKDAYAAAVSGMLNALGDAATYLKDGPAFDPSRFRERKPAGSLQ